MKIVTCASYYGSGSSAVMDLLEEYSNVKEMSDFEFRFLHDPDGISDLEYNLVENHNRHNSGYALKRFEKLSRFNEGNFLSKRYSAFWEKDIYRKLTQDYIDSLVDFKYRGWWFYDLYDKGPKAYYAYQLLNHLFQKIPINSLRILKNEYTLCSHPSEEKFLKETRKYIKNLLRELNKENKEILAIDQIVPSSNIERYLRYFEDEVIVVIVDRDPRDVYLLSKYYWKDAVCPKDVETFCEWFDYTRKSGYNSIDNSKIIKIQFEDLVYHYDEIVKKLNTIIGLKESLHLDRYRKFNPKKSMKNTRLWEKHKDDGGIQTIEERLSCYLYNYENIDLNSVKGENIEESKPF